jgi:hypothetical protein
MDDRQTGNTPANVGPKPNHDDDRVKASATNQAGVAGKFAVVKVVGGRNIRLFDRSKTIGSSSRFAFRVVWILPSSF